MTIKSVADVERAMGGVRVVLQRSVRFFVVEVSFPSFNGSRFFFFHLEIIIIVGLFGATVCSSTAGMCKRNIKSMYYVQKLEDIVTSECLTIHAPFLLVPFI